MKQKLDTLLAHFELRSFLWNFLLLTAGCLFLILSVDVFLTPSKISPGGVAGIAIILNSFTGWPVGLTMLVLNIPMMAFGFRYLGRFRFLFSTLYVVLLYNLGVDFAVRWLPPNGITDDLLLNALYSAVIGGIGTGLVYWGRGTTAGTGVLARVLQVKTGIPISQIYFITDGGIVLAAGLVFGWELALYAMITLFLWGVVADYVLEGPSVVRTAFIVTDSSGAVAEALLNRLQLGVTAWPAQGMFTETQHTVLFCTVNRPDVNALRSVITEVDPHAFVVIGHGHQASGGVFRQALRSKDG